MNKKVKTIFAALLLIPGLAILGSCDKNDPGVIVDESNLSISDESVEIYIGETHFLIATTNPAGQMVNWGSEDESIATINKLGKITGVKVGSTRVYCEYNGEKKYCSVTVLETALDVESSITLEIIESSGVVEYGNKQLTPKINGEAVTCSYSSENENIATVSAEGLVTAVGVGSTKIIVKYGESVSKDVTVTVTGPQGYYPAVSAQSAEVAANPGKWFYHTAGTASNFNCYHLGNKVHLEMNSSGANQTYLRYQVANFEADEIYQFTTVINVNKDCYVRVSNGSYTEFFNIKANTDTSISLYGLNLISNNCLSFLFLGSTSTSNYLKGFNATVNDITGEASISIDKREITLSSATPSVQLTASEDGVTWQSDNTNVARVDQSGLVTRVADGLTKVWAIKGNKKCFTNVSAEDKKLVLDKTEELLGVNQTLTIKVDSTKSVNVNEENVVWTSSNEDVATVINGVVTAKKGGYTRITAKDGGATAAVVVGVYGEENKLTESAENFKHKTTSEMESVGPGWYKLNYCCNSIVMNDGVITLTNNDKTFKDVQQIRYVPNDGNGNVYHGDYFIRYTVESGMKDSSGNSIAMTCASQRNGDADNVSLTATLNYGESETLQNVVHGVSDNSGFLSIKLKYPNGYGTITIKDIYVVKLS